MPAAEVYAAARTRMSRYVGGPAYALRAAKEAIDRGLEVDLDTGLEIERMLFAGLFATKDRAIGMRSFVEQGPGKAHLRGRLTEAEKGTSRPGGRHHAAPMVNKRSPTERIDGTPCAGWRGPTSHHEWKRTRYAMNIVVCVKYVPDAQSDRTFRDSDKTVDREGVDGLLSELDEYAVEEALKIVEAAGEGEVTVLTVGPDAAADAIKKALQMGAHAGVHVNDDAIHGSDAVATSLVLAEAVKKATGGTPTS